jgi:enediyne biosynthesis protein E4
LPPWALPPATTRTTACSIFLSPTFGDDYKVLYHNDGDASFTDVSYKAGIAQTTIPFVGWGDGFLDYDNDGWLDLIHGQRPRVPAGGPARLGHDLCRAAAAVPQRARRKGKEGKFEYVPAVKGTGLADVIPARGAAFGDLFNDGKIDVVINPIDGPPVLLRNVNPDHHHWVEMQLVGGPKEPARRHLRHGLPDRQRHAHAPGRAGQRQLHLIERSPAALRPGRCEPTPAAEIHWPSGAKETSSCPPWIAFTPSPKANWVGIEVELMYDVVVPLGSIRRNTRVASVRAAWR